MAYLTRRASDVFGVGNIVFLYAIPCLIVSHWVTMIVYLHHTDIRVPHYRRPAWNYVRGALATIDRDFLGWQGRFFLHDVRMSRSHKAHALNPLNRLLTSMWCTIYFLVCRFVGTIFSTRLSDDCQLLTDHGEIATKYLKAVIGSDYQMVSTPVFKDLWETYSTCLFVEDNGV